MFEQEMIQQKGFKNISRNGEIAGFQVNIRSLYYRGTYLSLVEGFEVTVDSEKFTRDQTKCTIAGRTYTLDEIENTKGDRWPWEKLATLTISKPGGLKPGLHEVQVSVTMRVSYVPVNPNVRTSKRKLTLVA